MTVYCTGVPRQRDPPIFRGNDEQDVEDWLVEYEIVNASNKWNACDQLTNVRFYLADVASLWFKNHEGEITNCAAPRSKSRPHAPPVYVQTSWSNLSQSLVNPCSISGGNPLVLSELYKNTQDRSSFGGSSAMPTLDSIELEPRGNGGGDSSVAGNGAQRPATVDESPPAVHGSSTSRDAPRDLCVASGVLYALVVTVVLTAVLVLWKFASRQWLDGRIVLIVLTLSFIAIASAFGAVFYWLYSRRPADAAESDGSSKGLVT
ncbi:hypothetical protein HPB51_005498 [Rhipicephalus microplus]|uniref:Uncharacterized protein n=1 Tax=Rhipicephalus microplus TaxID=6941 RepID=A0A9J6EYQ3_RHIMP|nr:hypothetical protein HPB51_005498 [Rhipicephalus microplus]